MERDLTKPKIEEGTVSLEAWVKNLESPLPKTKIGGGFLVESHLRGIPMAGSTDSVDFKVCLTYPRCKTCTDREVCPISRFKK